MKNKQDQQDPQNDGKRCDTRECSSSAEHFAVSGTRLDICNDCLVKLIHGHAIIDHQGFHWQNVAGSLESRHGNQMAIFMSPAQNTLVDHIATILFDDDEFMDIVYLAGVEAANEFSNNAAQSVLRTALGQVAALIT